MVDNLYCILFLNYRWRNETLMDSPCHWLDVSKLSETDLSNRFCRTYPVFLFSFGDSRGILDRGIKYMCFRHEHVHLSA